MIYVSFLNEIFALVTFKIEIVTFSLQVVLHNCKHLQIRDAIYKFNFKNIVFSPLKVKSLAKLACEQIKKKYAVVNRNSGVGNKIFSYT